VKLAYVLSRQSQQYSRLGASLSGALFLATPHRGKSPEPFVWYSPLVQDLVPGSQTIEFINEHFPRYCESLQLYSFYETLPMSWLRGEKSIVVPKTSAVLGYPREHAIALEADRFNMCKFDSPASSNYLLVRGALARLVSTARASDETTTSRDSHTTNYF
jgi:hypothetical protein